MTVLKRLYDLRVLRQPIYPRRDWVFYGDVFDVAVEELQKEFFCIQTFVQPFQFNIRFPIKAFVQPRRPGIAQISAWWMRNHKVPRSYFVCCSVHRHDKPPPRRATRASPNMCHSL